ncbi:hypothetical protein GCM10010339_62260 [Streptomyces alanosinicus]|uniref:SDR family oxidoreductase n=2 Tax=Streptomyces alanosinicus TaxID=68171 RepID=A0A918YNM9_9ACTN|nr:hypothetical protein GCM10010339_62260 [Streptomyces alanosinicus]
MIAVNIKAPFFLTQRLLPRLRDGGRIINISSVSTRVASSHGIGYPLTKGALEVFSHTLAKHLGPRGITVNSVAVGFTHTDMTAEVLADPANLDRNISLTALGRIGQARDIADAVAFLASDGARWITGTRIDVSGGVNLWQRSTRSSTKAVSGRAARTRGRPGPFQRPAGPARGCHRIVPGLRRTGRVHCRDQGAGAAWVMEEAEEDFFERVGGHERFPAATVSRGR